MSDLDSVTALQSTVQPKPWLGRVMVITAAVMWSTSGFFAKAPIFESWPLVDRGGLLTFWRVLFAATVLIFLVRKRVWAWKLVPTTLTFAAMNWTYMNAMVYSEATVAIWLQYTAPAWVFLGGWLAFREKTQPRDWLLLMFAAVGVAIILSGQIKQASMVGVWFGLGSGVTFAGVVLTLRWCRDLDSAWVVFLNHSVTAVVFAPFLYTTGVYPEGQQWIYLFGFGAFQLGVPYVLFASSIRHISSHEASGLALLEPLLLPVWVWVAWRHVAEYEAPAMTTLIGGLLILAGLIVRYVAIGEKHSADQLEPE